MTAEYVPIENDPRRWVQQLGAARIAWSGLSLDDLSRCAGDIASLADLVVAHYGISREDAEHQVQGFFARSRRFFEAEDHRAG